MFAAIQPRRLYRQVADQIRTLIESGEFAVGERLPGERELAEKLGVSRPTIREALIALEVEGLVHIRMGSGIYVTRQRARSLHLYKPKPRSGRTIRTAARPCVDRMCDCGRGGQGDYARPCRCAG